MTPNQNLQKNFTIGHLNINQLSTYAYFLLLKGHLQTKPFDAGSYYRDLPDGR